MINQRFHEEGSVLVEVLVAFAILVAVITAGFQIFGDGLQRSRLARNTSAEALEAVGIVSSLNVLSAGTTTIAGGDGRTFTLTITPIETGAETWISRRPFHVALRAGDRADGPPLLETILLSPGPP